jgi:hypothetical protein
VNKICLYLDEDTIKGALVKALRNDDLDVITVIDAQMLGRSDEEQLIWSTKQKRVIYTTWKVSEPKEIEGAIAHNYKGIITSKTCCVDSPWSSKL